jgi:hypothetical protein
MTDKQPQVPPPPPPPNETERRDNPPPPPPPNEIISGFLVGRDRDEFASSVGIDYAAVHETQNKSSFGLNRSHALECMTEVKKITSRGRFPFAIGQISCALCFAPFPFSSP